MKALRNLIALFAMMSVAAILTGCGDDDDDNNNNNQGGQGPQFAPVSVVALQGNTYAVTLPNGQTATLTFPSANTYSFTPQGGATETGNINGLTRQGEDWVAILVPADANGIARGGEIRLHFTQKTANTFAGSLTYQGANGPETVPFSATVNNPGGTTGGTTAGTTGSTTAGTTGSTTAGTTGTTTAGTTGSTTSGGTGLNGATLQLNYQGGGGEKFVFTSADEAGNIITGNASYENGADTATYRYDSTSGQLNFNRGGGQTYQMIIAPNSTTGTTTVTYQEVGGNPSNDPASYTLTR